MSRPWTSEEITYLQDNYDERSLKIICNHLNRTESAIQNKVVRLKLGRWYHNLDAVTLHELARATNISYSTLVSWFRNYDLPVKEKKLRNNYIRIIKLEKFWEWAENNKNMIEWDKFEKYSIGSEPSWVDIVRKAKTQEKDKSIKKIPWSKSDDEKLLWLLKQHRYTYPEISEELQRSHGAIKKRLHTLNIKLRPVYLDNHRPYSQSEIKMIFEMHDAGHSFKMIAEKLERSEAGVRGKVERLGYSFKNRVLTKC